MELIENKNYDEERALYNIKDTEVKDCIFAGPQDGESDKTRASLWYSNDGKIKETTITGVKALRECNNTLIENCKIDSVEFGWKTNNTEMKNTEIVSEYIFLDSKNIKLDKVNFKGKYSFQYTENVEIKNSILDTKDAFWHSKNVTVKDSVVKGTGANDVGDILSHKDKLEEAYHFGRNI